MRKSGLVLRIFYEDYYERTKSKLSWHIACRKAYEKYAMHFYLLHVPGENNISMGNISSLPISISSDRTIFDRFENSA